MSKRSAYILLTDMLESTKAPKYLPSLQQAIKQILENDPLEDADIELI